MFLAAAIGLWMLEPASGPTLALTYLAGCVVAATYLNFRRAPLWAEGGQLLAGFVVLLVWRAGLPLAAAFAFGLSLSAATAVATFRATRRPIAGTHSRP